MFMMFRGVAVSTKLAGFFFAFELTVLLVVAIAVLIKNGGHLSSVPFQPSHVLNGFSGLGLAFPLAIYLFIGWENSAALAEETNNPRRNVPRAVFLSIALMAFTYLLVAYATVTGFHYNATALTAPLIPFIAVAHSVAAWLAFIAYLAGLTSTLGVLIAAVNSQCRLIFNAGREGLLPRWLGYVHPVRRTPVNAIIAFVGIASAITLVWALGHWIGGHGGSLDALTFFFESSTMGTILILFVYLAANVALPFYYRKYRPAEFNIIKHVVLPALGVVAVAIPIYYLFKPPIPQPYDWFPWVGAGPHRGVHPLLDLAGQARPRPGRPGRLDHRRRITLRPGGGIRVRHRASFRSTGRSAMTDTAVRPDQTAGPPPAHPLDPATGAEYLAGREIMAAAGLLAEPVRFAYYALAEPPKDDVLNATPTDRRLRAFLVDTATGESTDVVVSLKDNKVVSARTLDPPVDGQMPILDSDFALVDEIVKADPGWRAAMARRGLHDVSQIQACPITAGAFGPPEDDRRRMVRVLAFVQAREHDLAWAHPVDGVAAYVDLIEKKVFKITDEFDLAVPAESGDYDDEAVRGPQRTTLRPIEITQPEGPSFILNGTWLQWQDWSMRIGFDAREGLTLHQVSLDERPVMYRASIPEMVVPYGDPRFRYWQAYFDSGEYLVGKWANSLELGCDCLGEIAYLDATVTDDTGQPQDHTERHMRARGGLRHPLEAHRHLQRLGPVTPPAPPRGELLHHGRQLRLRLLLVLLPGRHHRVRDQGDRGAVHLGASRRRPSLLHRSRAGARRPVPPAPVQRAAGHDRGRAGQRRGRGRRQRPADRAGQPLRQRHRPAGHPADPRVAGRPPG